MPPDDADRTDGSQPPDSGEYGARDIIESLIHETEVTDAEAETHLDRFLYEPSIERSLALWFGDRRHRTRGWDWPLMRSELVKDIAWIDATLNDAVNAILHHRDFQGLEASWRSLQYLVREAQSAEAVKIKFLDCSWDDLAKDAERSLEFDQSQVFKRVYEDEFGTPGGEPFGLLIGDYEVRHHPTPDHKYNDLEILQFMSGIAAAAFAPFITGLHPALLGLDSFSDLGSALNLQRTFEQAEYIKWKAFRDQEDSRFVGLVLPKVLARLPYADDGSRNDGFRFFEDVDGLTNDKYLWGNAAFCFGSVVIRSFANYGWLADIRGTNRASGGGGIVAGTPAHSFGTDSHGVAIKMSTEVVIDDFFEKELSDLGFIALCRCKYTEFAAFYSNQSPQKAKKYDTNSASENARLSTMLQYILCAGRFAHYIKMMARDKIGSFSTPVEMETYLQNWISQYTTASEDTGLETQARYPLREARVSVRERPGRPGTLLCEVYLAPHYQLDIISSSLRLVTQLATERVD